MVENRKERNKTIEEWSDERCIAIAFQDNFPDKVHDINIQKTIIVRFLKFYLSGKVQKGLSVTDIIFATISIMPKSWYNEKILWKDCFFSKEGTLFYLSPDDKLSAEIKDIMTKSNSFLTIQEENLEDERTDNDNIEPVVTSISDTDTSSISLNSEYDLESLPSTSQPSSNDFTNTKEDSVKKIKWYTSKSVYIQTSEKVETIINEPLENAAFCACINNFFNQWDKDEKARACLKYYFGLTALILMRTLTEPYHKVMAAFRKSSFRSVQSSIFAKSYYTVPDKNCINKTFKRFRKMNKKIQTMFARIVVQGIILESSDCYIKNVLNFGILSHTANFKMNLIKMLQELANRMPFNKFMELLNTEDLVVSRDRVHNFLQKYMTFSPENRFQTCHWARVIESDQFEYMSCTSNLEFAIVTAVFIEKMIPSSGIWNAKWIKDGPNLQMYKELGVELYEKYSNTAFTLPSLIELINSLNV